MAQSMRPFHKMLLLYLVEGMAECSLDLFFNSRQTICFSGWGGRGLFFQQLKLDFFIDKVKVFFLCNTIVYNCYKALHTC